MGILGTMSDAMETAGGYVKDSLKAGAMQVSPEINDFYTYQEMKDDPRSFANPENLTKFKNPNSQYRKLAEQKYLDINKQLAEVLSVAQMETDPKRRAVMAYAADYLVGGDQYRRLFSLPDDAADEVKQEEYYKINVDKRYEENGQPPKYGQTDWSTMDYKKLQIKKPGEQAQAPTNNAPATQGTAAQGTAATPGILPQQQTTAGQPGQTPAQAQPGQPGNPEAMVAQDQAKQAANQANLQRQAQIPGGITPEMAKLGFGQNEAKRVQNAADRQGDVNIQTTSILQGKRMAAQDPILQKDEQDKLDKATAAEERRARMSAGITRQNRKDMQADDLAFEDKQLTDLGITPEEKKQLKLSKLKTTKDDDPRKKAAETYYSDLGKELQDIGDELSKGRKVRSTDMVTGSITETRVPLSDAEKEAYRNRQADITGELNDDNAKGLELTTDEVKQMTDYDNLPDDKKKAVDSLMPSLQKAGGKGKKQWIKNKAVEQQKGGQDNRPPVEGARQAKDGNWYVQGKNGKYQKVIK